MKNVGLSINQWFPCPLAICAFTLDGHLVKSLLNLLVEKRENILEKVGKCLWKAGNIPLQSTFVDFLFDFFVWFIRFAILICRFRSQLNAIARKCVITWYQRNNVPRKATQIDFNVNFFFSKTGIFRSKSWTIGTSGRAYWDYNTLIFQTLHHAL